VLNLFATIGRFDEIGTALHARYAEVATNAEVSIPLASAQDHDTLAGLIRKLQAA